MTQMSDGDDHGRIDEPAQTRGSTRRVVLAGGAGAATLLGGCSGPGGGSGSEASRTPVRIAAADVPEGGGTVVGRVVLTQPSAGEYKAFDATCPHQGCAVSEVTATAIVCPCHGSEFDPASGEVTRGPAESGLAARTATVEGAEVVVT